jgi:hypothetical protein
VKTLAELRMELELGLIVYHATNAEVYVYYDEREMDDGILIRNFLFYFLPDGILHSISRRELELIGNGSRVVSIGVGYETLDELLTDWPVVTSEPVWTTKAPVLAG